MQTAVSCWEDDPGWIWDVMAVAKGRFNKTMEIPLRALPIDIFGGKQPPPWVSRFTFTRARKEGLLGQKKPFCNTGCLKKTPFSDYFKSYVFPRTISDVRLAF